MLRHDFAAIFIYNVPADIPPALQSVIMQRFLPQEALPETGFQSGHLMLKTGAFDAPFRASKDYTMGIAVKRATGCMDKAHKKAACPRHAAFL